jgi:hypothetical protein
MPRREILTSTERMQLRYYLASNHRSYPEKSATG